MSKMLVATKLFYSYFGKDEEGLQISNAHGVLDGEDVNGNIVEILTTEAKKHNPKVNYIHIVSMTPLEFVEVEA